jgi:tetratricopeptide (TPR) repeat protein
MSNFRMPLRLLGATIALSALLSAPCALAETAKKKPAAGQTDADSEARRLFKEGDKLYAEGDYEGAVRAFEKSYELSQQPALQYNLANAYERLGRYDDGVKALQLYEPHAASDEREVVRRRIKKLQERAEQQKKEAPAASPPSAPATAEAPASAEPAPAPAPTPEGEQTTAAGPPVLSYVLLGVGAVGIGVGSYFGLQALSSKSDAEKLCPSAGGKRTCPATADDALSSNTRNAVVADVGFGVGIAALAVGGYLLFSGGKSKETTATQLRPSAGPQGGGFSLIGTF